VSFKISVEYFTLQGGADKSLALPTYGWRRTEPIMSLERGGPFVCRIQVFSCYKGWKEVCQAIRAISTTSRRELSLCFFFLQGKAPKEIQAVLTGILWEHAQSCSTVKNGVAQFKRGDFSTCDASRLGQPTREIIDHFHELTREERRISSKSIAE